MKRCYVTLQVSGVACYLEMNGNDWNTDRVEGMYSFRRILNRHKLAMVKICLSFY